MSKLLAITIITIVLMTTGCSESPSKVGEQYLGTWVHTMNDRTGLVIENNDGNFLITITEVNFLSGRQNEFKFPAVIQDGMLLIRTGSGDINVMVDTSSGNLIANGQEYKRGEFQVVEGPSQTQQILEELRKRGGIETNTE